jgi:hypothetical protein
MELTNAFRHVRLLDFHKFCLPRDTFPALSDHERRMTGLFGVTYVYEKLFSKMKIVKSKSRNGLYDER